METKVDLKEVENRMVTRMWEGVEGWGKRKDG
jgi:hypothetical protein